MLVTGSSGFIGTNYIDFLIKNKQAPLDSKHLMEQAEFINLDINPPRNLLHKEFWQECNILDVSRLKKIIRDFSPTHVVHLAAKTGVDEKRLSDFAANTEGVENLLFALKEVSSVERVIFTSSLLVCRMGYVPKYDTDYKPTTAYGLSKVRMEQIIRTQKNLPYSWTIIRPISVWGPWFGEPYKNLFKAIDQGWYYHVGFGHYIRSMGYVENTAHQIHQLLLAPIEKVNRKTLYLADDPPVDLYDFANEVQRTLGAKKIQHVPLSIIKMTAKFGDILKVLGWKHVPLTSFRLNNILTEYVFDLTPIIEISRSLPFDFKTGVRRTIEWMRDVGELKF